MDRAEGRTRLDRLQLLWTAGEHYLGSANYGIRNPPNSSAFMGRAGYRTIHVAIHAAVSVSGCGIHLCNLELQL